MPGPVAIGVAGDSWVVVCRMVDCGFRMRFLDEEAASQAGHDHVVAAHPEVTQP